jgi:hypothetical protein
MRERQAEVMICTNILDIKVESEKGTMRSLILSNVQKKELLGGAGANKGQRDGRLNGERQDIKNRTSKQ